MQTIVVQGEYTTASYERVRTFVKEAKKRKWSVVNVNNGDDIENILTSSQIFENQRLVVIKDYKS